jgi:hypothetical protein
MLIWCYIACGVYHDSFDRILYFINTCNNFMIVLVCRGSEISSLWKNLHGIHIFCSWSYLTLTQLYLLCLFLFVAPVLYDISLLYFVLWCHHIKCTSPNPGITTWINKLFDNVSDGSHDVSHRAINCVSRWRISYTLSMGELSVCTGATTSLMCKDICTYSCSSFLFALKYESGLIIP